ncbi:MAG: hypothetical protein GY846_04580 [Deltaproteobacteria bacterium]|nr:hypothetical protein [Deltaproteobacteria bacterium]
MGTIKATLGYTIAVISILFAMTTFVGNFYTGRLLLKSTGLTISPWLIGGKVVRTVDNGDFKTIIHKAVFRGLLWEREEGFIQIDWVKKTSIPEKIDESIDYDGDTMPDLRIVYDTERDRAEVSSNHFKILPRMDTYKRDNGFTVRVWLQNPNHMSISP